MTTHPPDSRSSMRPARLSLLKPLSTIQLSELSSAFLRESNKLVFLSEVRSSYLRIHAELKYRLSLYYMSLSSAAPFISVAANNIAGTSFSRAASQRPVHQV